MPLRDDLVVQTACERDGGACEFVDAVPVRAARRAAVGDCDSSRTGGAIHRLVLAPAPGTGAGLRRDRRPGPRPPAGGGFSHGYYDRYCYLPLYVFCGQQLLGRLPSALEHRRLETCLVDFVVVGQTGFAREWPGVDVVIRGRLGGSAGIGCSSGAIATAYGTSWGWARNAGALEREVQVACEVAQNGFEKTGTKSRLFTEFAYAARTWRRARTGHRAYRTRPQGAKPALHRDQPRR